MRVDQSGKPSGIHKPKASAKASGKRQAAGGGLDSIQVADSSSLREKAHVMLNEMSAVRLERIEEIRSALEQGTFKSDSRKVAAQIVSNALAEHPWS